MMEMLQKVWQCCGNMTVAEANRNNNPDRGKAEPVQRVFQLPVGGRYPTIFGKSSDPRASLLGPALLGLFALCAIALGASIPNSPFTLHNVPPVAPAWFFGQGAASNHLLLFGLVCVYGGMLLLIRVWFGMVRWLSENPGFQVKKLVPIFGAWTLPMLIVPPLFSKDVYSYAAQGEMVSRGISPYLHGPGILGAGSPFLASADRLWQNAPTPYGPLDLGIAGFIVRITNHNVLASVVLLRLLEVIGVVIMAAFIPKLAKAFNRDPAEAFVLAVLNPITLLHLIAGAHNDALMVGLMVAGVTLAKRGRPIWGIVLCTLAAAVKVPAEIAVVYIGWNWLGHGLNWRQRVRPVLTSVLVSIGVMEVIGVITGLGWGWTKAMGTPGTVVSMLSPTTLLGTLLAHITSIFGLGLSQSFLLTVSRGLGLLAAIAASAVLLWFSDQVGHIRAMSISLLLFVALGPVVQPWYLSWGILLAVPSAVGWLRRWVLWLSVVVCFMGLPGGSQLLSQLEHLSKSDPVPIVVAALALVGILTTPLAGWARRLLGLRELAAIRRTAGADVSDELVG